jgi:hypothetical protein
MISTTKEVYSLFAAKAIKAVFYSLTSFFTDNHLKKSRESKPNTPNRTTLLMAAFG